MSDVVEEGEGVAVLEKVRVVAEAAEGRLEAEARRHEVGRVELHVARVGHVVPEGAGATPDERGREEVHEVGVVNEERHTSGKLSTKASCRDDTGTYQQRPTAPTLPRPPWGQTLSWARRT